MVLTICKCFEQVVGTGKTESNHMKEEKQTKLNIDRQDI